MNKLQDNVEDAIENIVESGSNANGRWIKYTDGTMLCTGSITTSIPIGYAVGQIYRSATIPFNNFAQTFVQLDSLNFNLISASSESFIWCGVYSSYLPTLSNPGRCVLFSASSVPTVSVTVSYIAIGRWK